MTQSQFLLEVLVVAAGVFVGLALWTLLKLIFTAIFQVHNENQQYKANSESDP